MMLTNPVTNEMVIPAYSLKEGSSFTITKLIDRIHSFDIEEKPHIHNWQEIIYIKSGKGIQIIDDKRHKLTPNTFYLIGQGQVHNFMIGEELDGYMIRFSEEFLPPSGLHNKNTINATLLGNFFGTNELQITGPEIVHYENLLSELLYEHSKHDQVYAKTEIIQYLLLTLLTKLERRLRSLYKDQISQTKDFDSSVYHSFLSLIEEHYKFHKPVEFFTKQLGIDNRKLSCITRKASNKTPKRILNERIMIEAKRMLHFTNFTLKEISYDLGYDDPSYFSRYFKLYTGSNPKKYRENYKRLNQYSEVN